MTSATGISRSRTGSTTTIWIGRSLTTIATQTMAVMPSWYATGKRRMRRTKTFPRATSGMRSQMALRDFPRSVRKRTWSGWSTDCIILSALAGTWTENSSHSVQLRAITVAARRTSASASVMARSSCSTAILTIVVPSGVPVPQFHCLWSRAKVRRNRQSVFAHFFKPFAATSCKRQFFYITYYRGCLTNYKQWAGYRKETAYLILTNKGT